MGIARSTYYGAPPANRDAESLSLIEAICEEFEAYGYRRVTAELRHQGHLVNSKRVRRLMREHGLSPKQRRRYVTTTDSDHDEPIFPNLAADMAPDGPNQLWVADITYVAIATGFVYLAAILDAWSRRVVGYAISRSIDARLTIAALDAAVRSRAPPAGCVHHSDRGSQYAALAYRKLLAEHKLAGSMGRRGNPYDNAKAESFMKTLKVEAVPDGLRDRRRRHGRSAALHRSRLQCSPAALSPRLPQPRPLRGSTRPAPGQNRSMTLSTEKGALHRSWRDCFWEA